MSLFDAIERRGIFDEEFTVPEAGGVAIPVRLRELSRKNDSVRFYIAEVESGQLTLIDGLMGCIEVLIEESRSRGVCDD